MRGNAENRSSSAFSRLPRFRVFLAILAVCLALGSAAFAESTGDAVAKARAAENRTKHGRTKGEKTVTKLEAERAKRDLDGAKREE